MEVHLEDQRDKIAQHPLDDPHLSLWSRVTFSWATPLLAKGSRHVLAESDCAPVPQDMETEKNLQRFTQMYDRHRGRPLWRTFVATFWLQFVVAGFLRLLSECGSVMSPILLQQAIIYCEGGRTWLASFTWMEGYLLCLILLGALLLQLTALQHFVDRVFSLGMQVHIFIGMRCMHEYTRASECLDSISHSLFLLI